MLCGNFPFPFLTLTFLDTAAAVEKKKAGFTNIKKTNVKSNDVNCVLKTTSKK